MSSFRAPPMGLNRSKLRCALLAGGLLAAGLVLAVYHGIFRCDSCSFDGDVADADTNAAIRSFVNAGDDEDRWQRGDTVNLCNATGCSTYELGSVFTATFIKIDSASYPNGTPGPNTNYGRTPNGGRIGGGGGGYGSGEQWTSQGPDDAFTSDWGAMGGVDCSTALVIGC